MFDFDIELFKDTIRGKVRWTLCPYCMGQEVENCNQDGEDIRPGPTSDPDRHEEECKNCEGFGFIILNS